MRKYILSLDNLAYVFMNEIVMFSQAIGQSSDPETTFNIYRELMSQILAAYPDGSADPLMKLSMLPVWPTILYVEDSHDFFDIKRRFSGVVKMFAMSIYDLIRSNITEAANGNRTYLMDSATVTLLTVTVYDNVTTDAAFI